MVFHGDRAERRSQLFKESLDNANQPKFGFFGYTASLAIGDDSLAPKTIRRTEFQRPGLMTQPPKAGCTSESFFSMTTPLCIDDPYMDPGKRAMRKRKQLKDDQPNFKPGGVVHFSINKLGYGYDPQGPIRKEGEKKQDFKLKNIGTGPGKKGGPGNLGPGVLFGFGEERKFPEHMPDDYFAADKIIREERKKGRAKMPEAPFRGSGCLKLGY